MGQKGSGVRGTREGGRSLPCQGPRRSHARAQNFPPADLRKKPERARKLSNRNTQSDALSDVTATNPDSAEGGRKVGGRSFPARRNATFRLGHAAPAGIDGPAQLIARNPGGRSAYPEAAEEGAWPPHLAESPAAPGLFLCPARSPAGGRSLAFPEPPRCRSPTSSPSIRST